MSTDGISPGRAKGGGSAVAASRLTRAERRRLTAEELLAAAERRFIAGGFHASSIEQIADEAGYTKGAVYSNFASKDDLFLAVYERRAREAVAEVERTIEQHGPLEGIERLAGRTSGRQDGRDDGWLAVFFEFWAHTIRHPELRERFAAIHASVGAPIAAAAERYAEARRVRLPEDASSFNAAMIAMQLGLALERLTQPELVDPELGARMTRYVLERLEPATGPPDRRERA